MGPSEHSGTRGVQWANEWLGIECRTVWVRGPGEQLGKWKTKRVQDEGPKGAGSLKRGGEGDKGAW